VDSPRSSGFRVVVRRRYSSSIYVQVFRMDLGSEGAPIEHSVMGPDDGDGNEYIHVSLIILNFYSLSIF
jgi:hypothetical protein